MESLAASPDQVPFSASPVAPVIETGEQLVCRPLVQQVTASVGLPAEATRIARSNGVREDPADHGLGNGWGWFVLLIHIWTPFRFVTYMLRAGN